MEKIMSTKQVLNINLEVEDKQIRIKNDYIKPSSGDSECYTVTFSYLEGSVDWSEVKKRVTFFNPFCACRTVDYPDEGDTLEIPGECFMASGPLYVTLSGHVIDALDPDEVEARYLRYVIRTEVMEFPIEINQSGEEMGKGQVEVSLLNHLYWFRKNIMDYIQQLQYDYSTQIEEWSTEIDKIVADLNKMLVDLGTDDDYKNRVEDAFDEFLRSLVGTNVPALILDAVDRGDNYISFGSHTGYGSNVSLPNKIYIDEDGIHLYSKLSAGKWIDWLDFKMSRSDSSGLRLEIKAASSDKTEGLKPSLVIGSDMNYLLVDDSSISLEYRLAANIAQNIRQRRIGVISEKSPIAPFDGSTGPTTVIQGLTEKGQTDIYDLNALTVAAQYLAIHGADRTRIQSPNELLLCLATSGQEIPSFKGYGDATETSSNLLCFKDNTATLKSKTTTNITSDNAVAISSTNSVKVKTPLIQVQKKDSTNFADIDLSGANVAFGAGSTVNFTGANVVGLSVSGSCGCDDEAILKLLAEGDYDFWHYLIWSNGTAEAWGATSIGAWDMVESWGSIYASANHWNYFPGDTTGEYYREHGAFKVSVKGYGNINKLFITTPNLCSINYDPVEYYAWLAFGPGLSETRGPSINLCRPTKVSVRGRLMYYLRGRWK